jgi:hypothetical protein
MSSMLRECAIAEREAFERSKPYVDFKHRKAVCQEIETILMSMPSHLFTVGQILYLGEHPKCRSEYQTWESAEMDFYSVGRLLKLSGIKEKVCPSIELLSLPAGSGTDGVPLAAPSPTPRP